MSPVTCFKLHLCAFRVCGDSILILIIWYILIHFLFPINTTL